MQYNAENDLFNREKDLSRHVTSVRVIEFCILNSSEMSLEKLVC